MESVHRPHQKSHPLRFFRRQLESPKTGAAETLDVRPDKTDRCASQCLLAGPESITFGGRANENQPGQIKAQERECRRKEIVAGIDQHQ